MKIDETYLTDEEKLIVQKLKNEMYSALTVDHIRFYKKEIEQIVSQAKRRQQFIDKCIKKSIAF
ncbi:hypothetical protein [Metabacillus fastidiosus]|uniref:Uncharacterized protein n=1 Tax=Metabacillus fastidiosus TaxID=1458 RepID=A0ABU6P4A1_9BACI|nr:hypothetical protein [Metabacillus fastidiosus]MED4403758.1 hypothetical protein [Metabacillus fastidiosus]MED4452537.1 hypothetical protein [Metabacillus fastidiosus]MED4463532.1 hypothetical protein [Metabacillus fastidiosus]